MKVDIKVYILSSRLRKHHVLKLWSLMTFIAVYRFSRKMASWGRNSRAFVCEAKHQLFLTVR